VVTAALPASEGGTARDEEARSADAASRGGFAAWQTSNRAALDFFVQTLPDGPYRQELIALEGEQAGRSAAQRIAAWTAVATDPADDQMAARAISRLAALGVMFAQLRAGHSLARITRALNDAGIPCPSAADPVRNTHRAGEKWTLTTVRAILANPRYTGREVWNRQPCPRRRVVVATEPEQPDVHGQGTGPQFPGAHQSWPESGQLAKRRRERHRGPAEKKQFSRPPAA